MEASSAHLQAGQDSKGPGSVASKTSQPKDRARLEELVAQLGDNSFAKREEAEKALHAIGAKAYPMVKTGLKSKVPEIVQRCERIAPGPARLRRSWLKITHSGFGIRKSVGKTDDDYKLYLAAVSDKRRAVFLEAAESNPANAGDVYQKELDRALKAFSDGYNEAEEKYQVQNWHHRPHERRADAWRIGGNLVPRYVSRRREDRADL